MVNAVEIGRCRITLSVLGRLLVYQIVFDKYIILVECRGAIQS